MGLSSFNARFNARTTALRTNQGISMYTPQSIHAAGVATLITDFEPTLTQTDFIKPLAQAAVAVIHAAQDPVLPSQISLFRHVLISLYRRRRDRPRAVGLPKAHVHQAKRPTLPGAGRFHFLLPARPTSEWRR
jgi:hypothetical protein